MIKEINLDGFNRAIITHLYEGGDCICTLQQVEVVDEIATVVRECKNIVLKAGVDFDVPEIEIEEIITEEMEVTNE